MNRVVHYDFAVGAKEGATATAPQMSGIGSVDALFTNTSFAEYASFEGDGIPIDSAVNLYSTGDVGFVSDTTSDGSGEFAVSPKISITLDGEYNPKGMTLYFLKDYCSKVRIKYYNAIDTLVGSNLFDNDEMVRFFKASYIGIKVKRVDIEFLNTQHSHQFAKLWKVEFGKERIYEKLFNANHHQQLYVNSQDLPIGAAEIGIQSDEALDFQDNQKILLYRGEELFDTLFVTDYTKDKSKYVVTAENILGKFDRVPFMGTNASLIMTPTWLASILQNASGLSFTVDDSIKNKGLGCSLPICTARYAIMQLAFALHALVTTTPEGEVAIRPRGVVTSTIDESRYTQATYKRKDIITQTDLVISTYDYEFLSPQYSRAATVKLTTEYTTIEFSAPQASNEGFLFKDSNGQDVDVDIEDYNDNFVRAKADGNIEVEIYAIPYTKTQTRLSKRREVTPNINKNVKVYDRYSIFPINRNELLTELYNFDTKNVGTIDVTFYLEDEKIGDVVEVVIDKTYIGVITSLDTTIGYNSLLTKAKIEVIQ